MSVIKGSKVNWLGQNVVYQGHHYMIIYFYLSQLQSIPINQYVFCTDIKPAKLLDPYQNTELISELLKVKNTKDNQDLVSYLNNSQIKFVKLFLKKEQEQFTSYLRYHVSHLGEILHYETIAGYQLAFIFDGSAIPKLYYFQKLPGHDFQLVMPIELQQNLLLAELISVKNVLQYSKLVSPLFVQLGQNEFLTIQPEFNDSKKDYQHLQKYVVTVSIWSENQSQAIVYTSTVFEKNDTEFKVRSTNEGENKSVKQGNSMLTKIIKNIIYLKLHPEKRKGWSKEDKKNIQLILNQLKQNHKHHKYND